MGEKLFKQVGDVVSEYTAAEYEQHNKDIEELRLFLETQEKIVKEMAAKKAAAEEKLLSLGLTIDDLKALGLN